MPQMNKGGKFIFGTSALRPDGRVQLPPQAANEYHIASEGKVYLFTGSKVTGGFCVTRQGLLLPSKLGHILTEMPPLLHYEVPAGTFLPYKGRAYCWTAISAAGEITLTPEMRTFLRLTPGTRLLCIRSSSPWGRKGRCWKRRRASTAKSRCFERARILCDFYFDIARIGPNLASAAGCGLGNVYAAGIGIGKKYLIREQTAGHMTGTGRHIQFGRVAAVECHVARTAFDRNFFRGNHSGQREVAGCSA